VVSCYNLGSVSGAGQVGQLIGLDGAIQYSYYLDDNKTLTASGGGSTSTGCKKKNYGAI
jgi:hypothetical protein